MQLLYKTAIIYGFTNSLSIKIKLCVFKVDKSSILYLKDLFMKDGKIETLAKTV